MPTSARVLLSARFHTLPLGALASLRPQTPLVRLGMGMGFSLRLSKGAP